MNLGNIGSSRDAEIVRCGGKLKRAIQGFTSDKERPPMVGFRLLGRRIMQVTSSVKRPARGSKATPSPENARRAAVKQRHHQACRHKKASFHLRRKDAKYP
jgi:hypothetical protein